MINKRFLIHDHLYKTLEEARLYDDGKDVIKPVYTIEEEDDKVIYKTRVEAEEELKQLKLDN